MSKYANILSIERHRINIDGNGVRTLVCFGGCPLSCKYCLNPQCHNIGSHVSYSTVKLLNEVSVDNIYFMATNGGITFGGGEPIMQSDFIAEFCDICPNEWDIAVETSLNISSDKVIQILPYISSWIIDIKDINSQIYRKYTKCDNKRVIENLMLLSELSLQKQCNIRVPLILNYNTEDDLNKSIEYMRLLGFENFDTFNYVLR